MAIAFEYTNYTMRECSWESNFIQCNSHWRFHLNNSSSDIYVCVWALSPATLFLFFVYVSLYADVYTLQPVECVVFHVGE